MSISVESPAPSAVRHIDLTEVLRLLRRRLSVVLGVVTLFTGTAVVASHVLPPRYTAVATILVEGSDPAVLQSQAVVATPNQNRQLVATHVELLSTDVLLRSIVKDLELQADPEFNASLPGGPRIRDRLEDTFGDFASSLPSWLAFVSNQIPQIVVVPPEDQERQVLGRLRDEVKFEQAEEAYTISVRVTSYDPGKAPIIANAIVDRYVAQRLKERRGFTKQAASFLEERLQTLRNRAEASATAVATFMATEELPSSTATDPLTRQIDALSAQLVLAEIERTQAEAELQRVQELLSTQGSNGEGAGFLFASPLLLDLRREESDLNRKAAELAAVYGERHPSMHSLKLEIGSVRERAAAEIARILEDHKNKVRVARAKEAQLRNRHEQLTTQSRRQQFGTVNLRELERQAEADRTIYAAFLDRFKEVNEQADLVKPDVTVVSPAQSPAGQSFPRQSVMVSGAFAGSFVLGLIAAFIVEILDTRLRSAHQIETSFGIPVLAHVPAVPRRRLRKQPLHTYVRRNLNSSVATALDRLMIEILQSSPDKRPQVVVVTSALPGEGKTTLAVCLAMTGAASGQKVVIVDLDLHRPRVSGVLQIRGDAPGVVEVLTGEATLDDALVACSGDNPVHALLVQRTAANATALLTSHKMAQLIATLRNRFDLIILDTPPVLAVGDTRALAKLVDNVLFVVLWGKTRIDAVRSGIGGLREASASIVGVVFNRVSLKRHAKLAYGDSIQYYRKYAHYYRD